MRAFVVTIYSGRGVSAGACSYYLLMPVDRRDVLKLISEMDAIADCAEDVGVLLTIRPLKVPDDMKPVLDNFVEHVLATIREAAKLIDLIDDLVESGFAGPPAEQILQQAAILGRAEHEADKIQDQCAKVLFKEEDSMPPRSGIHVDQGPQQNRGGQAKQRRSWMHRNST